MKENNQRHNHSLWEMIVEWFKSHTDIRLSIEHYKNFWYIWEIMLMLTFGIVLLSPVLDWYYRIILSIMIGFVLWGHLKDLCNLLCNKLLCKSCRLYRIETIFFSIVFIGLLVLLYTLPLVSNWLYIKWLCVIMLCLLMLLIILRPMNAVYGLMGTSGSIRIFFFNFLLISLIFSLIYYFGFFKTAGITYDVNQPHIDFLMYAADTAKEDSLMADTTKDVHAEFVERVSIKRDTVYLEHQSDRISFTEKVIHITTDTKHYQKIDFWQVWRSTIMTTLTQESTDLLSIATVHNVAIESTNVGLDKEKSELFEYILIFHIVISWIFFGVFISLLYNKFRYES